MSETKRTKTPKDEKGRIDKEKVRQMYMDSNHIEWIYFAEEQGWNPARSRSDYPVATWTEEKRKRLELEVRERINEAIFVHGGKYHLDVLKTLSEYPALCDRVKNLFERKLEQIESMPPEQWQQEVTPKLLQQLSITARTLTDAKYRSMLVDKWSFDIARQQASENSDKSTTSNQEDAEGQLWVTEIMGENGQTKLLTSKEIGELAKFYYDPPQRNVNDPQPESVEDL